MCVCVCVRARITETGVRLFNVFHVVRGFDILKVLARLCLLAHQLEGACAVRELEVPGQLTLLLEGSEADAAVVHAHLDHQLVVLIKHTHLALIRHVHLPVLHTRPTHHHARLHVEVHHVQLEVLNLLPASPRRLRPHHRPQPVARRLQRRLRHCHRRLQTDTAVVCKLLVGLRDRLPRLLLRVRRRHLRHVLFDLVDGLLRPLQHAAQQRPLPFCRRHRRSDRRRRRRQRRRRRPTSPPRRRTLRRRQATRPRRRARLTRRRVPSARRRRPGTHRPCSRRQPALCRAHAAGTSAADAGRGAASASDTASASAAATAAVGNGRPVLLEGRTARRVRRLRAASLCADVVGAAGGRDVATLAETLLAHHAAVGSVDTKLSATRGDRKRLEEAAGVGQRRQRGRHHLPALLQDVAGGGVRRHHVERQRRVLGSGADAADGDAVTEGGGEILLGGIHHLVRLRG
eukprot:Rhum_TRINITY_DN1917_c0_g1::Rhum_TRINITY_DN1917_c0_g1_i1::g.5209::m.5209